MPFRVSCCGIFSNAAGGLVLSSPFVLSTCMSHKEEADLLLDLAPLPLPFRSSFSEVFSLIFGGV